MAKKATKKAKADNGALRDGISHHLRRSVKYGVKRRFVPRDVIILPWGYPIKECEVIAYLKSGYEVRIGGVQGGIRLFPYLNTDFKTQRVVAQSFGVFRWALKNEPWNESGEVKHDIAKMRDIIRDRNRIQRDGSALIREGVTPDKMVECPNCGTAFRVGKRLV